MIVGKLAGDRLDQRRDDRRPAVDAVAVASLVFWVVQMLIIWRGMEAVRRFENWTAPLVSVGFLILLAYVLVKAGGFGPILSAAVAARLGRGLLEGVRAVADGA